MSDKNKPAFPVPGWKDDEFFNGMTLRDYFAAKALPVVASGSHLVGQDYLDPAHFASAAHDAYRMADAMLEARETP